MLFLRRKYHPYFVVFDHDTLQDTSLKLFNKLQSCLDRYVVGVILMDLSKWFDCLLHDLLLTKFHAYGLDSGNPKVLEDYFSNRYKRPKLDRTVISWFKVLLAVPQGSIFSQSSLKIFINDVLLN